MTDKRGTHFIGSPCLIAPNYILLLNIRLVPAFWKVGLTGFAVISTSKSLKLMHYPWGDIYYKFWPAQDQSMVLPARLLSINIDIISITHISIILRLGLYYSLDSELRHCVELLYVYPAFLSSHQSSGLAECGSDQLVRLTLTPTAGRDIFIRGARGALPPLEFWQPKKVQNLVNVAWGSESLAIDFWIFF